MQEFTTPIIFSKFVQKLNTIKMKKIFLILTVMITITMNSYALVGIGVYLGEGDIGWGNVGYGNCHKGYGICFDILSSGGHEGDQYNEAEINIEKNKLDLKLAINPKSEINQLFRDNKITLKNDLVYLLNSLLH